MCFIFLQLSVLCPYLNVSSALLEFVVLHDAERVVFHRERVFDDFGDVVGEDPVQGRVKLGVDAFDVVQSDGLVQEHLVERRSEAAVNIVAVKDSHSDDAADKVKVAQMVLVHGRVGIDLKVARLSIFALFKQTILTNVPVVCNPCCSTGINRMRGPTSLD
jgi:hypothetical protein